MHAELMTLPLFAWASTQDTSFDEISKDEGFASTSDALRLGSPPDAAGWPNFGEDDFDGSDTD